VTLRGHRGTIVEVEKKCVTYLECVLVTLGIHDAMRMRHFVICGLSGR